MMWALFLIIKVFDEAQLGEILQKVLYEFPVRELDFALPRWVTMLDKGHWLQTEVYTAAMQLSEKISRMKDVSDSGRAALDCEAVENAALSGMNLADGVVRITVLLKPEVFYKVLSEQTGLEIGDEAGLMPCIIELAKAKRAYEKIRSAMEQVEATGYGIVMPSIDELSLEQPEIVRLYPLRRKLPLSPCRRSRTARSFPCTWPRWPLRREPAACGGRSPCPADPCPLRCTCGWPQQTPAGTRC